jgi:thiosulfate/3-mercaptopyruvate sulfurtransferase
MVNGDYPRQDLLVETDWLESRLENENIRVIDCDQYESFARAHIKNAVGIPEHHYLKGSGYLSDRFGHPHVSGPDHIAELMSWMGIDADTVVVAYDHSGGLYAARLWWVLNHYGHTEVKVLNGGWTKWFDEKRPVSIDSTHVTKKDFVPKHNPDSVCTLEYGIEQVGNSDTVFLDVRSDGEWDGSDNTRGNERRGRIPGAVHLEWLNFIRQDRYRTVKPASEIRSLLEGNGVTLDKQIITY